jgi:hypothetical protein
VALDVLALDVVALDVSVPPPTPPSSELHAA